MGRRPAGSTTEVKIAGRGGVAADASAALITLTAVLPSANTFLTVFPCGTDRPNVSNLNSPLNDIRANSAFVKLSATGTVCVYTVAATDFIIDINGFVPAGGSPTSLNPARVFDSRPGEKTVDGQSAGIGRRPAGSVTEIKMAGRAGIAADATGVVMNLTSVLPAVGNFLTAYPCGTERPNVSNINSPINDVRANSAFVKLGTNGAICVYTVYETDFVIDVNGFVPAGGAPTSVNPVRLFDSRPGEKTIDGQYVGWGQRTAGNVTEVKIAGRGGVPADATAAIINLTSVFPTEGNFLTAFPCGVVQPNVSNLNSPANDIRASSVFVQLSTAGTVCIYTVKPTHYIIDVNGYSNTPVAPPVITTCTINGVVTQSGIPQSECQGLVSLYNATGGATWTKRTNWMTNTNPCTWAGVTCFLGHVTQLDFYNNNMTGALPAEIGNFPGVKLLRLSNNKITSVPPQIANLTSLITLELQNTPLTSLPAELAKAPNLNDITLGGNNFAAFPPVLGTMTNLRKLGYLGNKLTAYPTQLNGLTNLEVLNLYGNQISSMPGDIGKLTNLTLLDLGSNQLTGLPNEITALKKLSYFSLAANQIAVYPAPLANMPSLTGLELYNNKMTVLPPEVGNLVNLKSLSLSSNSLTVLPAEIGKLTQLSSLSAGRNQITTINAPLGSLPNLTFLYLNNNQLSGDITAMFAPMMSRNVLKSLWLYGNKCLSTTDPAVAAWLTTKDPAWKSAGCP